MRNILLTCTLVCLFMFSGNARTPEELFQRVKDAKSYPGANYVVLFDSTSTEVKESGLSYVAMHKLIKIQTAEGVKDFRVFILDYDPLSAFVAFRKARIYRQSGEIEVLSLDDVKDYPAPARAIYWGARQKMLEIGRLEPGDAIELKLFRKGFTYALLDPVDDDRYIPPMRGHFYDIIPFWTSEPVERQVYRVSIPEDKKLQYKFYNGDVQVASRYANGQHILTFTRNDIMPFTKEPDMVNLSDEAPKLLLSTSPDWEAKAMWFYNVNEDYGSFETTPEITAKVNEILEGAASESEKISRLTHWVADEIRYSGLSMGPGEGYTLHTGEMTFRDRCGVCKDKAGMLVTMLRAAGFESYAAMTMAGSRIDRIPADQFNHSVTVVKRSDGTYQLLDPTWVPFVRELWSSAEQQQQYLMGLPEGSDLETTPISPPEKHYYRLRNSSRLNEDGTLLGELTLELEGQSDAVMRRMFTRDFKTRWKAFLESQFLNTEPAMQIKDLSFSDPYDYSDPFQLTVSYTIPGYAEVNDNQIIFTPLSAKPFFNHRYINDHLFKNTGLEERNYAFYTRCSKLIDIEEEMALPGFNEAVYIPADAFNEGSGADIDARYTVNSSGLQFKQVIRFKKRIYNPDDWPSYRHAVLEQKRLADEKIILNFK